MKNKQKISTIHSGIAGVYAVASELCKRGFTATTTMRNSQGVDIFASDEEGYNPISIQVKTSQKCNNKWPLSKSVETKYSDDLFYIFVNLNTNSQNNEYFIVPSKYVAKYVKSGHARWLKTLGKNGQKHNQTDIRQFDDKESKFKDRWDLLGLRLK